MKVVHVLNELNPSGAETMLYAAGPLLKNFGLTGEILSTGSQVGPYDNQLAKAGYTIHHISFKRSPLFFWSLFRFFHENKYDVIHLHTERANFWFGVIALLTGRRTVRTIHNTFPFEGWLGWRRKWQRQLLNRLGVTHVTISRSVQETEKRHYQLETPIIQNWYNSERFRRTLPQERVQARTNLNIPDDSIVILTVGNCSPVKNHTELIRALAVIENHSWLYLHIGIEKDSSERALAADLGLAERIHFLGMQADILPFLQAADLYVMPSTHEGSPIAAIEAMATGVPVLLANAPGLADFKIVFRGLLYCNPDCEALAVALTEILSRNQDQLRQQCSDNPQIAEQHFGVQRGLTDYVNIYKKVRA